MKELFAFTITTKNKYYDKGDCIFGSDGDTVGRVLNCMKNEVDPKNVYYSYDVESTPAMFTKLKNGYKLYKVEYISVQECGVYYTRG